MYLTYNGSYFTINTVKKQIKRVVADKGVR
jgi:hypothetical protein